MTWTRSVLAAAVPVAAVAVIAGVVSYSHIEALGLATGQTLTDARLLPLAVDGLIVAGSVILLAGSWLGWIGVVLGVSGTVYANVMSGLPRGPLAATVAAWPALAFTVASFMLERWLAGQSQIGAACADFEVEDAPEIRNGIADLAPVPSDAQSAALAALRATTAAGNPLSGRQLETRFGLTRADATRVRELVAIESNGHPIPEELAE